MDPVRLRMRTAAPPAQETRILELLRDLLDGETDVGGSTSAGADQLAAAEEEDDHARFGQAADESGELLRFVFHAVEAERDRDRGQVDLALQVRGRDDVLNLDLRVEEDLLTSLADHLRDDPDRLVHLPLALPAGADDLPRAEQEDSGPGLLEPVDYPGELFGLVLRAIEGDSDRVQV